jgi:hypothetical protein
MAMLARPTSRVVGAVGWLPPIALVVSVGLLLCSVADALSLATLAPTLLIYWLGILAIALPVLWRLTSEDASPGERLALVCLLGLALYGVKVMRDAPMYTFSDEMVHAFNAKQISSHHHLFHHNPILTVTPRYPGLEGAASALMALTGLSSYVAGAFLIAAARLVMVASLFFLFQRVSGSARIAGLGAAIFAGSFNFLFWDAQFSYQSLALPLLLLAMMALAEREAAPPKALGPWAVPLLLSMMAVVVTHHLTSYAMALVLVGLSLAYWWVRRDWRPPNPWPFAIAAVVLAVAWLVVVASSTIGYLSPVISDAVTAVAHTVAREQSTRGLFHGGGSTAGVTPIPARGVALLAVALLAAALPFGLLEIRRRYMNQPFALLFALSAVGFFCSLALRLAPAAWETGNRASEFLFVGLAFVIGCAALEGLRHWSGSRLVRPGIAAGIALVLVGGAIAGWPWDSQLAQPLRVTASGNTIVSPPLGMTEWAQHEVRGGRFAATTADAGLLLAPGGKFALAGSSPDVEDLLAEEHLSNWELPLLRRNKLRYVVADRRAAAEDSLRGYYFAKEGSAAAGLTSKAAVTKFNRVPGATRVYTNGTITVFDLGARP